MGRVVDLVLPRLGETMDEGRIGQWLKRPGERFRRGEILLEVESDKTTVEVPALQDGWLIEVLASTDQMVPVAAAIARIEIEGDEIARIASAPALPQQSSAPAARTGKPHPDRSGNVRRRASTAARAVARRANIDLAAVTGSGRNGRITRADLATPVQPARPTVFVETPHGRIFMREWPAQGPAHGCAVLLHGLFADSQGFVILGRKLASQGYRTLAVDLPGHGQTKSPAVLLPAIVAAVESVMPKGMVHIVGHSFGAIVAAHLTHRAASLTLLAPAGCGEDINGKFIAGMLGGQLDHALSFLGEAALPPEAVAALASHLAKNAGQLRAIAAAVSDGGQQIISILARLQGLAIPVNVVFARDDNIVPASHALNLPSNAAVRFIAGSSHLPHWRDPELIVRLVASAS